MTQAHQPEQQETTIIIGLGNDFVSDDGIGVVAMRQLAERLPESGFTFRELSVGGLELLDHLVGHDRCIIIDAVETGKMPPGTIVQFDVLPGGGSTPVTTSHQIDLRQVLALADALGEKIPRTVSVFGIEAADVTTFRIGLTPEVSRSIPGLVETIWRYLQQDAHAPRPVERRWRVYHEHALD